MAGAINDLAGKKAEWQPGMKYYFLVSSLPALRFEEPPPLSFKTFLAACRAHLSPADLAAIDALCEERRARPNHPALAQWHDKDVQLRNALARFRADRLHADEAPFLRVHDGFDVRVERVAAEAYGKTSPLERESLLDRFRWTLAEELGVNNPFSGAAVLSYALRLQIAERWAALNDADGTQTVERIASRTVSSEAGRNDTTAK
jgi:hypothetical protein